MVDTRQTESSIGNKSLYQSPHIQASEKLREDRASKRKNRLEILRAIKAKKG